MPVKCAKFAVHGTYGDTRWTNVFHALMEWTDEPSYGHFNTVTENVLTEYEAQFADIIHEDVFIVNIEGLLRVDTDEYFNTFATEIMAGNIEGPELTAQTAQVISWRT